MSCFRYIILLMVISVYCQDHNTEVNDGSTTITQLIETTTTTASPTPSPNTTPSPSTTPSTSTTTKTSLTEDDLSNQTNTSTEIEKVKVEVYYESLCPFCIRFFVRRLAPEIPSMHQYLDIRLYPYGNAYTNEVNGQYKIDCQHGESECYGNKLHACSIDILKNVTKSSLFICCLSDWRSNDKAVDECAKTMKFDGNPIKECAKGDKGNQLLKYYGDESNKIYYSAVPYVLINGEYYRGNFKKNVCMAFKQPPPPCANVINAQN